MLIVAALAVAGVVVRLLVADQSLFADELSTRWMIADRSFGDVIAAVHTDAEITPPLYFAASWLTTQLGLDPLLVRAPSLIAGAATIPLVYLVGVRTVRRPAALVAAALTALSPFMIFYSAEARGYALMAALVLLSTLALLLALEGRPRWWVAYGACTCLAVYSHYTSVFALAAQLLWLLWAHPDARRPALIANAAAAVAFLPWIGGLRGDLDSPTTDILSSLQSLSWGYVRTSLSHWAIGFPYATPRTRVWDLPGTLGLLLIAAGVALAAAGLLRARPGRPDPRVILVAMLAVSVPLGELAASLLGANLLGVRNLAASWPAYALCLAAFLVAGGPRIGRVAAALVLAGFALGAVKMLDPDFARPDYDAVVEEVERGAAPGDVVIDGASLSPAGVPTAFDAGFGPGRRLFELGRDEVVYDPFRIVAPAPPPQQVVRRAAAAAGGDRINLVLLGAADAVAARRLTRLLPPGYRQVEERAYGGIAPMRLLVFEDQTATGA
jgi:4-amino-4-deoxy-L-arabinose transferase-like glycosyltransferase